MQAIERLTELGRRLPESHRPTVTDLPALIAGILYWLETGSDQPPEPETAATGPDPRDLEIAALRAEVAKAQEKASTPLAAPAVTPGGESPGLVPAPEPPAPPLAGQPPVPPAASAAPVPPSGEGE